MKLILVVVIAMITILPSMAQQQPVFSDAFNYTGWSTGASPMTSVWSANSGVVPSVITNNPTLAPSYIRLGNGVITAPFTRTLTTDFTLNIDVLHDSYQRWQWVGLFNSAGTQGYGFGWDSSVPGGWGSQGTVSIRKFSVSSPTTGLLFNTTGTLLGSVNASGHNPSNTTTAAISAPFAHCSLGWHVATHQLQLIVDGAVVSTVTDASFTTFSRIYVSGNTNGLFGNVNVTTPGGANVAFTTIEAEDTKNTTTGTVVKLIGTPGSTDSSPELEASCRGYVSLAATGQSLQIPIKAAANTIVLRHCIPDAAAGGGLTGTLSLYVNGTKRQTITLSSLHNWLYGTAGTNGQSNSPTAGVAHVFWDESRFWITGGVNAGDILTLQKDVGDTAAYYKVDCVDLESVGPALSVPPAGTYLNVKSAPYNAYGDGVHDDTSAIQACLTDAAAQHKIVWIPQGTYVQSAQLNVNGVIVQGAGMWYTSLIVTDAAKNTSGYAVGFTLLGTSPEVHDLYIDDTVNTYRGGSVWANGFGAVKAGQTGAATDWLVQNCWVTHTGTGAWLAGSSGQITGCRIRNTYADAINLNLGASDNMVDNNHVRGCGDDGIAILADQNAPQVSTNDKLLYNTVVCTWWGSNCDIAGGSGHEISYNYLADNAQNSLLTINLPPGYPMNPLTGALINANTLVRGGGNAFGQHRGAIWIWPGSVPISNTYFQDNYIYAPVFRGIHMAGSVTQSEQFDRNQIVNPGMDGIQVDGTVVGSGVFNSNTVTGLGTGYVGLRNQSATYATSGSGNSW
ncbi:MAG TPA: glycosyl hydrolase family 28-related protein [Capsulimonadaceae bacterium]